MIPNHEGDILSLISNTPIHLDKRFNLNYYLIVNGTLHYFQPHNLIFNTLLLLLSLAPLLLSFLLVLLDGLPHGVDGAADVLAEVLPGHALDAAAHEAPHVVLVLEVGLGDAVAGEVPLGVGPQALDGVEDGAVAAVEAEAVAHVVAETPDALVVVEPEVVEHEEGPARGLVLLVAALEEFDEGVVPDALVGQGEAEKVALHVDGGDDGDGLEAEVGLGDVSAVVAPPAPDARPDLVAGEDGLVEEEHVVALVDVPQDAWQALLPLLLDLQALLGSVLKRVSDDPLLDAVAPVELAEVGAVDLLAGESFGEEAAPGGDAVGHVGVQSLLGHQPIRMLREQHLQPWTFLPNGGIHDVLVSSWGFERKIDHLHGQLQNFGDLADAEPEETFLGGADGTVPELVDGLVVITVDLGSLLGVPPECLAHLANIKVRGLRGL